MTDERTEHIHIHQRLQAPSGDEFDAIFTVAEDASPETMAALQELAKSAYSQVTNCQAEDNEYRGLIVECRSCGAQYRMFSSGFHHHEDYRLHKGNCYLIRAEAELERIERESHD